MKGSKLSEDFRLGFCDELPEPSCRQNKYLSFFPMTLVQRCLWEWMVAFSILARVLMEV